MSTSMNYDNTGRRNIKSSGCGRPKAGVRLNPRRFSVSRLGKYLIGVLRKWRNSYNKTLRQLRRKLARRSRINSTTKNVNETVEFGYFNSGPYSSVRTMAHSNSFCSEAIADCLDFIKRNSDSAADDTNPILLNQ